MKRHKIPVLNLLQLKRYNCPSPWKRSSVEKFRKEQEPLPGRGPMRCGTYLVKDWPGETEPPQPDENTGGYQEPDHIRHLRLALSWGLGRTIERGEIVEVPLAELGRSTPRDNRKSYPEPKAKPPRRPRQAPAGRHWAKSGSRPPR